MAGNCKTFIGKATKRWPFALQAFRVPNSETMHFLLVDGFGVKLPLLPVMYGRMMHKH